jgi:hypothetical protein
MYLFSMDFVLCLTLGIFSSLVPQFCIAHFYCAHLITYNFIHYTYSFKKIILWQFYVTSKHLWLQSTYAGSFVFHLHRKFLFWEFAARKRNITTSKVRSVPIQLVLTAFIWFISHAWFCIYVIEGKAVLWFKFD